MLKYIRNVMTKKYPYFTDLPHFDEVRVVVHHHPAAYGVFGEQIVVVLADQPDWEMYEVEINVFQLQVLQRELHVPADLSRVVSCKRKLQEDFVLRLPFLLIDIVLNYFCCDKQVLSVDFTSVDPFVNYFSDSFFVLVQISRVNVSITSF